MDFLFSILCCLDSQESKGIGILGEVRTEEEWEGRGWREDERDKGVASSSSRVSVEWFFRGWRGLLNGRGSVL